MGGFPPRVSELWGFKFRGVRVTPNFQRPLATKLCVGCNLVLEVQERYTDGDRPLSESKFGGARTSHAARGRKSSTFFVRHAFELDDAVAS